MFYFVFHKNHYPGGTETGTLTSYGFFDSKESVASDIKRRLSWKTNITCKPSCYLIIEGNIWEAKHKTEITERVIYV